MSATRVWMDIQKQDTSETRTSLDKPDNIGNHIVQTWFAEYASNAVTATEAQTADDGTHSIPTVGSYYIVGGQNYMLCTHAIAQRVAETSTLFSVQVEYERQISTTDTTVTIDFSGKSFTQTVFVDRNGDQVANSAGQQFSNQPTKTYYDEQFSINYKTTSPPDLRTYRGKVNSDSVSFTFQGVSRTYAERELLFVDGSMSSTLTLGDSNTSPTPIWDVRLQFCNRVDGYYTTILDAGMYQLDASGQAPGGGVSDPDPDDPEDDGSPLDSPTDGSGCTATAIVRIKDKYGNDVTSAVNLDGNGMPNGACAAPVFLTFEVEDEVAMSSLFSGI